MRLGLVANVHREQSKLDGLLANVCERSRTLAFIECRAGFFQMVEYCKKRSHDASHDALFIVCRCQNSSDDCQPGLKTKNNAFFLSITLYYIKLVQNLSVMKFESI